MHLDALTLWVCAGGIATITLAVLLVQFVREGFGPKSTGDDAYGDGLTAADFKRFHDSVGNETGAQHVQ